MRKNPSKWSQRIFLAVISGIAAGIAVYLGLFQWRLVEHIWDPFFGAQSEEVIGSPFSHDLVRILHMPDAVLGALSYIGDVFFALAGSNRRWVDRPWLVLLFGAYVIPPGLMSAFLVLVQALVLGKWCFLCLVSVAISIAMVDLAYQEVWYSIKLLRAVKRSGGKSLFWRTLRGNPSETAFELSQQLEQGHVG